MTRSTRRPLPPSGVHEGGLAFSFGMLAERPGSQLDLVAEAGVETIGPSTFVVRIPGLPDSGPFTRPDAEVALATAVALGLDDAVVAPLEG